MFGNILWISLINIKRRKAYSITYGTLAFFISQTFFLVNISREFLRLSDVPAINTFFYVTVFSVLIVCVLLIPTFTILYVSMREKEFGILRIFGAKKSEVLFMASVEMFIISGIGAVAGVLCVIILIYTNIIYLPYFLAHIWKLELVRFFALAGQAVSGVVCIELAFTVFVTSLRMKRTISGLLRGSI
jgi:ABC-type lipoprotein release transport system permease subunit